MKWKSVSIREIAKVHYGKALKAQDRIESGTIPVYGSSGRVGTHIESLVNHPTLIIGRKGSVGQVTYAEKGGWPIDTVFYTQFIHSETVDIRYFFYALKQAKLDRWTITTSIPGLNRDDLYSTKIPLPPIAEQRRIAAILDKADAIRRKRKQAIQYTEELLRATFLDMFGEYLSRDYVKTFLEVSEVLVDCRNKTAPYVESGIPLIRTTNFRNCKINLAELRYVTPKVNEIWSSRHQTSPGDIVYCREAPFGMAAIVPNDFYPCLGQRIMVSRPNTSLVLREYLWFALNSSFVYKQALNVAVGSTVKHLRVADVEKLEIPVPPLNLQKKFSNLCRQQIKTCAKYENQDIESGKLFNSLLQRAFRGEL